MSAAASVGCYQAALANRRLALWPADVGVLASAY